MLGVILIADLAVNVNAAGGVYVKIKGENNEFANGYRLVVVTVGVNVDEGSLTEEKA